MKCFRLLSPVLCLTVGLLILGAERPAFAVDPQGNLSGIWSDGFGNEFLLTQRGNRRVAVTYLTDAGNLIWSSASGQGRKDGNQWVLDLNLKLKAGGTQPRRGKIVVGQGRIVWGGGNPWTLVATQQMRIDQLQQALFEAQAQVTALGGQVAELLVLVRDRDATIAQLRTALASSQAEAARLQSQLAELDAKYASQMNALMNQYISLQNRYGQLLKDKQVSDAQRQQLAEQLEQLKDQLKPLLAVQQLGQQVVQAASTPINFFKNLLGV